MSTWQPTASLNNLRLRAVILAKIRRFFAERDVLEVDTPTLSSATVSDPHLHSMSTQYCADGATPQTLYLQTSPEYGMKRLLAAGSGSIYQICKAFRDDEKGRHHNPEFTMLEWYRLGFDHHALMNDMDDFLQQTLNAPPAIRLTYAEVFLIHLNIDPHTATLTELQHCAEKNALHVSSSLNTDSRDTWLQVLMNHLIEPHLGKDQPTFLYHFPVSQAALAKIHAGPPAIAERFEVYVNGIELANGFHELTDAKEQRQRFESDCQWRTRHNYPPTPIDENLLAALASGLPACAGVALGIDRLVMLAAKATSLEEVIAFPIDRA